MRLDRDTHGKQQELAIKERNLLDSLNEEQRKVEKLTELV